MRQTIQLAPPAVDRPASPYLDCSNPAIRTDAVYVVFTTIEATLAAVRAACDFAQALGVPVTLMHFRMVPYTLPLDEPSGRSPAETGEFITRLRAGGFDVRVSVYLCCDECLAARLAFNRPSLIVVAGRRGWWPTSAKRWHRELEKGGHLVVVVDVDKERAHA